MSLLADRLSALVASTTFSGVVRLRGKGDRGRDDVDLAAGYADRANGRPNAPTTRFATASGTKGFTALTVMALVEAGRLELDATARSLVGRDLPHIDPAVTVEHLLAHRSGIGDYLDGDEPDDVDAHALGSRSAHLFESPVAFVALLGEPAQHEPPGAVFRYNDAGYVILSLIVERLTGSFVRAVDEHVFSAAGMTGSGFFRSDDLPSDTATGYLVDGRSNVHHLPVIGAGDGGAYATLDDLDRFWDALLTGAIVSAGSLGRMTAPASQYSTAIAYGLGFWVSTEGDHVWLEGMDAGVSFQSGFIRSTGLRYSVLSNTSSGTWPLVKAITAG